MLQERPQGSTPRDIFRSFLDDIVVRQLLAEEAMQHPKKLLPAQETELATLHSTLLRNRLFEVEVTDSVSLDGYDLDRFKSELTWALDLRAFVFDSAEAAQAWYTRLVGGTPISRLEALALREEPGAPRLIDLGRRVREQMTDSVATVVFDLPPGRFSRPVGEWGFYAIYHVTNRRPRPNSTNIDDPLVLQAEAKRLLASDERERYRRRLGVEMEIRYETVALDTIVNRFLLLPPRVEESEGGGGRVQAFLPLPPLQPSDSTLVLARTKEGAVTGRDLVLFLVDTPAYARPEVRARAQLIPWVDRVAFEQELLQRARARGLERDPGLLRELERRHEGFQVEMLYADSIESRVTFPEDSLRAIYNADSTSYDIQEVAKVWAIFVESREEAARYLADVQAGADADSIARRYSIHPESAARGGVSDFFRKGMTEFQNVEEAIFATPVQGYGGPLQTRDGWVVFRVLQKASGADRTYEDVLPELRRAYQPRDEERLMQGFLERLRVRYPVTLYPEKLAVIESQLVEHR